VWKKYQIPIYIGVIETWTFVSVIVDYSELTIALITVFVLYYEYNYTIFRFFVVVAKNELFYEENHHAHGYY